MDTNKLHADCCYDRINHLELNLRIAEASAIMSRKTVEVLQERTQRQVDMITAREAEIKSFKDKSQFYLYHKFGGINKAIDAEDAIRELKVDNAAKEKCIDDLRRHLHNQHPLSLTNDVLETQLGLARASLNAEKFNHTQTRNEKAELKCTLAHWQQEASILKQKVDGEDETITTLHNENHLQQQAIDGLRAVVKEKEQVLHNMSVALEDYRKEGHNLRRQLHVLRNEPNKNAELRNQIWNLEQTLHHRNKTIIHKEQDIAMLHRTAEQHGLHIDIFRPIKATDIFKLFVYEIEYFKGNGCRSCNLLKCGVIAISEREARELFNRTFTKSPPEILSIKKV